jgi:hypothetical protein
MRFLLALACLITAFALPAISKSQTMTNNESSVSSQEVQSLKTDIHNLEANLQRSRTRQDGWNDWYLRLGVAALAIATLLGVASWVCQKKASSIELASRPTVDKLASTNARLREVLDQASKLEVAKAQAAAAEASVRAGNAETRAAEAQSSLSEAERHSAEANAKAEGFRLDIAKANEGAAQAQAQVAEAQRAAAEANRIAESERLARLQLEARLADRILSPGAISELTSIANRSAKGTRLDICTLGNSLEVANIARAIASALSAGGWEVRQWAVTGTSAARGILIGTKPDADATATSAASEIILTMNKAGISAVTWDVMELMKAANSGLRTGPGVSLDAPILMVIGSKQ